jgi:hypothetical protein
MVAGAIISSGSGHEAGAAAHGAEQIAHTTAEILEEVMNKLRESNPELLQVETTDDNIEFFDPSYYSEDDLEEANQEFVNIQEEVAKLKKQHKIRGAFSVSGAVASLGKYFVSIAKMSDFLKRATDLENCKDKITKECINNISSGVIEEVKLLAKQCSEHGGNTLEDLFGLTEISKKCGAITSYITTSNLWPSIILATMISSISLELGSYSGKKLSDKKRFTEISNIVRKSEESFATAIHEMGLSPEESEETVEMVITAQLESAATKLLQERYSEFFPTVDPQSAHYQDDFNHWRENLSRAPQQNQQNVSFLPRVGQYIYSGIPSIASKIMHIPGKLLTALNPFSKKPNSVNPEHIEEADYYSQTEEENVPQDFSSPSTESQRDSSSSRETETRTR